MEKKTFKQRYRDGGIRMLNDRQQQIYDLKKAEKILAKHKILDAKQKQAISAECSKCLDFIEIEGGKGK